MNFSEYLNECMLKAHCNARQLSEVSGISQAMISRYRNGERTPAPDSEQLERLIKALIQLSQAYQNNETEDKQETFTQDTQDTPHPGFFTEEELLEKFSSCLLTEPGSVSLDAGAFNAILIAMDINIKKLAQFINYDPSYISRIRSGQRKPSNPVSFIQKTSQYLLKNCNKDRLKKITSQLSGTEIPSDAPDNSLEEALTDLLIRNGNSSSRSPFPKNPDNSSTLHFVQTLNEFDLDEYIQAIHFDTLHVPTSPIQFPTSKFFYGIEEMRQGEIDFFRQTVLSRAKDPIYMCSDMDMADLAKDLDFGKKWMFGIAAAIKKGLRLNIIHTLDRPFDEMMLGLESWIPIYMTGQVTSYYLPGPADKVYSHLHYVSGAVALSGECIRGHHDTGRYFLTNNKKEVAFYRNYCSQLFSRAKPLITVFTEQTQGRFTSFLSYSASIPGARRFVLSSPPLASMSEELLERVLTRCDLPQKQADAIRNNVSFERKVLSSILSRDPCMIELSTISREEFEGHPAALSLSSAFLDQNLFYTWDEYQEHLESNRLFVEKFPLSTLTETSQPGFRSIQIHILKGKWALISKNISPVIHFLIQHPSLRSALENMVLPVVEEKN